MGKRKKRAAAGGSSSAPASAPAHYNPETVKLYARNRWPELLSQIGGIPSDVLDGGHHPCPKCRGTDRFRFTNLEGDGSCLCNQCGRGGDGFAALEWFTGRKFIDNLRLVAEHLGVQPDENYRSNGHHADRDPAEHLKFQPWDESAELLAGYWCLAKPPITVQAIRAAGGLLARYRDQYTVIALPVWGELRFQPSGESASPVGWCIYNASGGPLPKWRKRKDGEPPQPPEWVKVKLTAGSKPGVITDLSRIQSAVSTDAWKVEGPTDLLAALSLPDLHPEAIVITNANGAKEHPPAWVLSLFGGHRGRCVHDADRPGQDGALGWTEQSRPGRDAQLRVGWATAIASVALDARNVLLPYPIEPDHGRDLRDFCRDGRTYADLLALADASPVIPQRPLSPPPAPQPIEDADDPHRLARANLDRYSAETAGGRIVYWREEWYTWKSSRGCYRTIKEKEFQAKVTASIKAEFNQLWQEEMAEYEAWKKSAEYDPDADKGPPKARKVTKHLVGNVISATASLTCLPSSIELMTWIAADPSTAMPARERRPYVAMKNGVIDLEKLLADADESECVLPLSPNWFSTVRLPYAFDHSAKCPKWDAFLEKNLQLDPERIKILQEWAGYCLTTDTGQQKFLALEGEGSNGKSVFCAGLTAMLGIDNCSHLGLESFGPDFDKADMIGKLVNICADVGEVDKLAEGHLKSFTSGDVVHFKRKHISGISCIPTARLIISFNNRPRFSDRSFGIWRRMLLIPWLVEISERDRVPNMDKAWWWERQGELPGMFNWALIGLARLRAQGRFTDSTVGKAALEDYRAESNPVREFLQENFQPGETSIRCSLVYHFYCMWCQQTGHRPFGDRVFGREIKRVFKKCERKRVRCGEILQWNYFNISFAQNEICGQKIEPDMLF